MTDVVLYVGSGISARKASKILSSVDVTCAVNNAWQVFDKNTLDYWVHSGDFPASGFLPKDHGAKVVSYYEYKDSPGRMCEQLGMQFERPEYHIGYTLYFQGLFWILDTFKPKRILHLGFDHDYNKAKTQTWREAKQPTPHDLFGGANPIDAIKWGEEFFKTFEPDFFYGHGTPDPLRLGEQELVRLFKQAEKYAANLGCELLNASGVTTGLLPFKQWPKEREHFDFIEIGTCDFDTQIASAPQTARGLSVEPVGRYLDVLPSPPNVIKLVEAVSDQEGFCEAVFVSREDILKYELPTWLAGCTRIDDIHPIIQGYLNSKQLPLERIQREQVPMTTLDKLYERFNIGSVGYLKIDTEGHDTIILDGFARDFVTNARDRSWLPKKIFFESNSNTPVEKLEHTLVLYQGLGYVVIESGYNTTLVLP